MERASLRLPAELERYFDKEDVARGIPFPVPTYPDLVKQVAQLAHANPSHLLFFRGQGADYVNKGGRSTFYPSIYRADPLPKIEIESRFARLKFQGTQLALAFKLRNMPGAEELEAREILQWSIIQHYEQGDTPLLDLTHSLAVACSFAQEGSAGTDAFIYAFGLPHITNRISVNSEHNVINVRLLSICPPDALRPYFQEGYLAGTWDVTDSYTDKTDLDFNRRLLAKFQIPNDETFWGASFGRIPRELLYPDGDVVKQICDSLATLEPDSGAADLGLLLLAWQDIERLLTSASSDETHRMTNPHRAIRELRRRGIISESLARDLDELRDSRNRFVHGLETFSHEEARRLIETARRSAARLEEQVGNPRKTSGYSQLPFDWRSDG